MRTWETLAYWISSHFYVIAADIFILVAVWRIRVRSTETLQAKEILNEAIVTHTDVPTTLHPEVNPSLCAGCSACTRVCPEGDILKIVDHKAVLVSPTQCIGHGECEQACPTGAISLVFGTKSRGMNIPRISSDYETNIPGLYIAGELGGMGLIRNAIKQGRSSAHHALTHLSNSSAHTDTDILIVGAGPAGIAAALEAIANHKSYICIDQNSFGGTVANFPRQKIVMTYPLDLPIAGAKKFKRNLVSKEELLEYWSQIRIKTGLKIQERTRFETLKKIDGIFEVKTTTGTIRASKVILCTGVRGTPNRLGLPNEDLPKVTYNLIDPDQYQGMHIAIVGAGNSAAEAACSLAEPRLRNQVTLLVRSEALNRCNETDKQALFKLEKSRTLRILYSTAVAQIESDSLTVNQAGSPLNLKNDYLLILAGSKVPHEFLMSLGVPIDTKFGESLKKTS